MNMILSSQESIGVKFKDNIYTGIVFKPVV